MSDLSPDTPLARVSGGPDDQGDGRVSPNPRTGLYILFQGSSDCLYEKILDITKHYSIVEVGIYG